MVKHIFTSVTGNVLSQAIMLVAYLIFARLYSLEDFGRFALVMSIAIIFGAVSCCRYELAILLSRRNNFAALGLFACLILTGSVTLLTTVVLILFKLVGNITSAFLLGVFVGCFVSVTEILYAALNRLRRYSVIAATQVFRAFTFLIAGMVVSDSTSQGLVYSISFSYGVALLIPFYSLREDLCRAFRFSTFKRLSCWLKKYQTFPEFSLPAAGMNSIGSQLPVIAISALYGIQETGIYGMLSRLVFTPIGTVSGGVNRVVSQKIATLVVSSKKISSVVLQFSVLSLIAGSIVTSGLLVLSYLSGFEVLLGNEWAALNSIIPYFAPFIVLSFCAKSVARFSSYNRNRIGLLYQSIFVTGVVAVIGMAMFGGVDFDLFCRILSIGLSLLMLVQLAMLILITYQHDKKVC